MLNRLSTIRAARPAFLAGVFLVLVPLAASARPADEGPGQRPAEHSARGPQGASGHGAGHVSAPAQQSAIVGAALTIVADGTQPWEDRPFALAGVGTLPGQRGTADPGDDLGPQDGVVRSWDAVVYRASMSVRDAAATQMVAEVTLTGPVAWERGQVAALRLSGCPGGASLSRGDQVLRCIVGNVSAPPAVTVALDLTARVSGAALQGDAITAAMTVRSPGATPDPDPANCPIGQADGCDAVAPNVLVSASPAGELRKTLRGVWNAMWNGQLGRTTSWQLDVIVGADGDIRGSSPIVGAPWTLPDWWRPTGITGRVLDLPVSLVGCSDLMGRADWNCVQPGGPGTDVSVTLQRLDLAQGLPQGVTSSLPQVVTSATIDLWVPEADLQAAGGDVTFRNCYATRPGSMDGALWAPTDPRGQPNLGGLAEPTGNNCSFVVLAVPRAPPRPPPSRPGRPGRPGRPAPIRPTPTAVPRASATKYYTPYTQGAAVTDGSEFGANVRVDVTSGEMPGIVACDKWDNSTHVLREAGAKGARVWLLEPGKPARVMTGSDPVVVEYGMGSWGRQRSPQVSVGRGWYVQATTSCADQVTVKGTGWVAPGEVDFGNAGGARLNAADVNMIRARFLETLPVGTSVWLEVYFTAEHNPPGTWLMNYGSTRWGSGSGTWQAPTCYGAQGAASRRECPVPAPGTNTVPGPLGDMLVHVGVPVWIAKRTDPAVPGGSPVITAGDSVAYVVEASTFPRPADPPPPAFPPGARAVGVVLEDTLPVEMTYELGTATVASEDLNANGVLDPGEDRNGNGRIDRNVPFEPTITPGPGAGETTLRWPIGDLAYRVRVPSVRYEARVSRLVRGGTALYNRAAIWPSDQQPPDCTAGRDQLGRCAWAQIVVANIAAAQVEKVPVLPLVLAGEPLSFRLALANLTARPVEWFDAVDLLPQTGEPRSPETRLAGGYTGIRAEPVPGGAPIEVWASGVAPDVLDTFGGGLRDGLVDPIAAWGGPGASLGGPEWPCLVARVTTGRCAAISGADKVTALRIWGPDPRPGRAGAAGDSFLPAGASPRYLELTLDAPGANPDDLAHNAWGGRFESLPLPVYDSAIVLVRAPNTPTPTITPPPSATPRPSATPPATITPTPQLFHCYLPAALRVPCSRARTDAVLVIDASSSMRRAAGDGGTKQEAVLRAARAFLDAFLPGEGDDRVAVVAFNESAWTVQPLTRDRALLDAALASLPSKIREGTRLDSGLRAGADALAGVDSTTFKAMVFLTDGVPNHVPTPVAGGSQEDTVAAAAAEVRALGIVIHTVGYGREDSPDVADRILPRLLIAIAGDTGAFHQTDDASQLARVFQGLALDVACAVPKVWP